MSTNYSYIIMSQKDMLQNQVLEEILRERANYYLSKNRNLDFWILISPEFLNIKNLKSNIRNSKFFDQHKNEILDNSNTEFYSALISLDKDFIKWIKLRLGYFEDINNLKEQNYSAFYVSDGIFGEIDIDTNNTNNKLILNNNKEYLHPKIVASKLEKNLEIYYSLSK